MREILSAAPSYRLRWVIIPSITVAMGSKPPPSPPPIVPQPPIPIPPAPPAPPPHLPPQPAPPALPQRGDPPSKQKSIGSGMGAPGKPVAGTPKSRSNQSAPRAPVVPVAAPAAAPQQPPAPQPPPPRANPEPAIPASAPDFPQVLASPAAKGGVALTPRNVKSPMIERKSAPNTPAGTPAVSAKSVRHVEFVPPTEYVDMSRIAIRSMQFVFVCEMFFHICGVAYAMLYTEMFYRYKRTFTEHTSKASMVAPGALGLAALLTFRTIHGVFAINFTTPSNMGRASVRLLTLLAAHILYGAVMMSSASMFKGVISSDELQDLVRRNIAHLIRYATSDRGYMEEINRIQQNFQCCGMKSDTLVNGSYTEPEHPWNIWFDSYSLDETYPSVIRELYSLPWSCCNLTFGVKCEHIGVSRYLRKFASPTDFNDVETVLLVHELDWNPTSFEHYLERNELAISTLYNADCAEEVKRGVDEKANLISSLIFKAVCAFPSTPPPSGVDELVRKMFGKDRTLTSCIVMLSCSIPLVAAVAHLQCIMKSRGQTAQAQVASSSSREVGAGDKNRVQIRRIGSRPAEK